MTQELPRCGICGRSLDQPNNPLSRNCWGCIGESEGDPKYGYPPAIRRVQREITLGLRPPFGPLHPAGRLDED